LAREGRLRILMTWILHLQSRIGHARIGHESAPCSM
jgi:hypothetical protein